MLKLKIVLIFAFLLSTLIGCAAPVAHRSTLVDAKTEIRCNPADAHLNRKCADITPEISSDAKYELHFVEFDDQGWEYDLGRMPVITSKGLSRPTTQTDHLMKRLRHLLDVEKEDLNIVLYVHGWKHSSESGDWDVRQFRKLLSLQSRFEQHASIRGKSRRVVGIYVGWEGKGLDVIEPFSNVTFWTRKAAALRISRGSVIDLFSRMQSLQQYYNGPEQNPACNPEKQMQGTAKRCKIRSLMVGHSFGAWILYSALGGSIVEALNTSRDFDGSKQKTAASVRPADLVVLINPAFEAVRYEPVHRAAMAYRAVTPQPPMLVSITSTGDQATRFAFPIGRFINTIFQRTGSDDQLRAMTRTHGHLKRLQTHHLTLTKHNECPGYESPGPMSNEEAGEIIEKNVPIEQKAIQKFDEKWRDERGFLRPDWVRDFCDGATLTQFGKKSVSEVEPHDRNENFDPNSLVWNIRADKNIIADHSSITGNALLEVIRQLYDDTAR